MTDKMVDVGGRRRPAWPTSAADIVEHQADVGRRHFFSQFADTHTNVLPSVSLCPFCEPINDPVGWWRPPQHLVSRAESA